MPSRSRIIKRESEDETCSRRDIKDEPPCHSSDRRGPPGQARSYNIASDDDDDDDDGRHIESATDIRSDDRFRRLLAVLAAFKHGGDRKNPEQDRATYLLPPAQFARLEKRLNNEDTTPADDLSSWYSRRARYDYEPASAHYTLRMPTAVHECFTASVVNAVERAIDDVVEQLMSRKGKGRLATANALKCIFKGGSTTIELYDVESDSTSDTSSADRLCGQNVGDWDPMPIRRSPDASFYHRAAAELPQLVVEVGYSQQRKGLDRIGESYITDSRHAIRCVLGFDIPYTPRPGSPGLMAQYNCDRTATVTTWRPAVICGVGIAITSGVDAFRLTDGTPADGNLTLCLADVLPQTVLDTLPDDSASTVLEIPFALLVAALDNAERCQATMWDRPKRPSPPTTPTKFRKRRRSPSPALEDEREQFYARQERAEARRNRRMDRAWRSPSGNRVVWHEVKPRRSPRNQVKIKPDPDAG